MKLLFITSQKESAFSHYRGHTVLQYLKMDNLEIESIEDEDFKRHHLIGKDIVFVQRPENARRANICILAKKHGLPLIVDFDDDFFNISKDSFYHKKKEVDNEDYQSYIKTVLDIADIVIVSTVALFESFGRIHKQYIISNAYNSYLYQINQVPNYNKIVVWRGSGTHKKDLEIYKDEITALIQENTDFNFCFWSDIYPQWIVDLYKTDKNVKLIPHVHPFDFQNELNELKPGLVMVPLEDCLFNHAKSDIAKLEAVASGSFCLCPRWEEWDWKDSSLSYEDNNSFYNKGTLILNAIRNKDDIISTEWESNVKYLIENRLLEQANERRVEIIKNLT